MMLPGKLDAAVDGILSSSRSGLTYRTKVLFAAMHRVLHDLSVWRKRAAGRCTLASLDDYLLRDMGLTRADVERELRKPFWRA